MPGSCDSKVNPIGSLDGQKLEVKVLLYVFIKGIQASLIFRDQRGGGRDLLIISFANL